MREWKGNTPMEKFFNDLTEAYGSTNFQSVINLFCHMKTQGVPEHQFPRGILCISDGEFNPAQLGQTNVETSKNKLRQYGFSKEYVNDFVIALWDIPNEFYGNAKSSVKFETFGNVPNVFYMSGYSPSIVSFLSGKVSNAKDLFEEAMDQEVLRMIKI
jgi:hypothetical protein